MTLLSGRARHGRYLNVWISRGDMMLSVVCCCLRGVACGACLWRLPVAVLSHFTSETALDAIHANQAIT